MRVRVVRGAVVWGGLFGGVFHGLGRVGGAGRLEFLHGNFQAWFRRGRFQRGRFQRGKLGSFGICNRGGSNYRLGFFRDGRCDRQGRFGRELEPQLAEGGGDRGLDRRQGNHGLGNRFGCGRLLLEECFAMFVATELVVSEGAHRRERDIAVATPHESNLVSILGPGGRNYYAAKCLRGIGNCAYNPVGTGDLP